MSRTNVSSRFATIFDTLPESARRAILEDELFPLIDSLSVTGKIKLLVAAEDAKARYEGLPRLDITAKKNELEILFDELRSESYHGYSQSHSEEILEEIVESITAWLSDIWQTVYECGVDFQKGHECLLYSCEALQKLVSAGATCKCGLMNMYVMVTIKGKGGTVVKKFSYHGAHLLEDAFLWIWRDMLLKMLHDGRQCQVDCIPQMLRDIQYATVEWSTSLDRLLVAGGKIHRYIRNPENLDADIEDEEDEEDDGYDTDRDACPKHAAHWSSDLFTQLPVLHRYIVDILFETFKVSPSISLYISIIAMSPTRVVPLLAHLRKAVVYSSAAAAAALDIHTLNEDAASIIEVLDVAQPILRPRDATSIQNAVHFLSHTKHISKAREIISRELRHCVEIIHNLVVNTAFGGVDNDQNRDQLADVIKLRPNSAQRQEGIERWVNTVLTRPSSTGNPLTFAAFLMGFPPDFDLEDTEEPDPFMISGIKEGHPDYEDLRDQWRPRLKERFEGWVEEAKRLKPSGHGILTQVMKIIGESMPYACGPDIIEEMISRIQDKPTKHHICDAMEAISSFMKSQKKRELAEKRAPPNMRKAGAMYNTTSGRNGDPSGSGQQISANDTFPAPLP